MKKIDEQLIISILEKDEQKACLSIEQGAKVNLLIRQTHKVETPEGLVISLCGEKIETPLMIACRLNLHKVVFSLLEHGADENKLDNGNALKVYREANPSFEMVRRRLISKHNNAPQMSEEKVYAS